MSSQQCSRSSLTRRHPPHSRMKEQQRLGDGLGDVDGVITPPDVRQLVDEKRLDLPRRQVDQSGDWKQDDRSIVPMTLGTSTRAESTMRNARAMRRRSARRSPVACHRDRGVSRAASRSRRSRHDAPPNRASSTMTPENQNQTTTGSHGSTTADVRAAVVANRRASAPRPASTDVAADAGAADEDAIAGNSVAVVERWMTAVATGAAKRGKATHATAYRAGTRTSGGGTGQDCRDDQRDRRALPDEMHKCPTDGREQPFNWGVIGVPFDGCRSVSGFPRALLATCRSPPAPASPVWPPSPRRRARGDR